MNRELQLLKRDIKKNLRDQQPELALDRLHTLIVKIIRKICETNEVKILDDGNQLYPLHSLIGMLVKKYKHDGKLNEFSELAIKQSISLFEKFNDIRNNNSFAHDNDILEKEDAKYVINTITSTLNYIIYIETGEPQYVNTHFVEPSDVYRYVCINDIVTTQQVAENFGISADEAREILIELYKVDRKIKKANITCNIDSNNCQWIRNC